MFENILANQKMDIYYSKYTELMYLNIIIKLYICKWLQITSKRIKRCVNFCRKIPVYI